MSDCARLAGAFSGSLGARTYRPCSRWSTDSAPFVQCRASAPPPPAATQHRTGTWRSRGARARQSRPTNITCGLSRPTTTWVDDHLVDDHVAKKALHASRVRACVRALRRQDRVPGTHRKVFKVIEGGHLMLPVCSQQIDTLYPQP
jgi:hypothetical protein